VQIKSEKDFWSGLMFIAVGAGFAIGALDYSFGSSARPGPAYFPFGLGVLLAVLGAMVLFKAMTFEVEGGDRIGHIAWRPLLIIVLSVAGFGVILPKLGMLISLPLLVIVSALAGDQFRWKEAVTNAAILTVGCWFIFIYGLSLTIPLYPNFR
jgi:Tripartite tricarboxylate transporter TctB family